MTQTAQLVRRNGQIQQTHSVVATLNEEISHYKGRLALLSNAELDGISQLEETYREMIRVREQIRNQLLATLDG